MYRHFTLVSSTPVATRLAGFRSATLETARSNLSDNPTAKEKLDFVIGIERLGVPLIKDASRRPTEMSSEVLLGMHTLWDVIIMTAETLDSEQDAALHDQLVLQLLWTREFDTLCRELYPSANPFPSWEAYEFAERLQHRWDELLAATEPGPQHRNLATFSAKVLAAGICRDSLARTALSCLQAFDTDDEAKAVAWLPTAVAWIYHCRHQLLAFSAMNKFGGESGCDAGGYSLDRWLSWRKRLQQLSHHTDTGVASEAKKGFMSIISCGLDLDCDVPGEAAFRQKVAVVMMDEVVSSGKPSVEIDDIEVDVDWVDRVGSL